jgi:hypothetical protein
MRGSPTRPGSAAESPLSRWLAQLVFRSCVPSSEPPSVPAEPVMGPHRYVCRHRWCSTGPADRQRVITREPFTTFVRSEGRSCVPRVMQGLSVGVPIVPGCSDPLGSRSSHLRRNGWKYGIRQQSSRLNAGPNRCLLNWSGGPVCCRAACGSTDDRDWYLAGDVAAQPIGNPGSCRIVISRCLSMAGVLLGRFLIGNDTIDQSKLIEVLNRCFRYQCN